MLNDIQNIAGELANNINPSAFTTDSIQGWITIALIIILIYEASTRAMKIVGFIASVMILFQVGFWLSATGMNYFIPLSDIFKYDIFTSIAQCFAGTRICDALLWADAFMLNSFAYMFDSAVNIKNSGIDFITT